MTRVGDLLRRGRRLRDELTKLAGDVDGIRRQAGFTVALEAMARCWRYSPFNQYLVRLQKPDARTVASRGTWATLGRAPKPGVQPILILAPAGGGRFPFVVVPVYDVSQTRGRRLAPAPDIVLRGRSRHADTLARAASRLGIRVERLVDGPPGALGRSTGGTIWIRAGLPGRERAATIAHELAHELLHHMRSRGPRQSHAERETEADATSYVVMRALGLPSTAPAYIAWNGGSGAMVLASLKRIQRAARRILRACGM